MQLHGMSACKIAILAMILNLPSIALATNMTYAGAGVDTVTADRLVDKIKPLCKNTNRPGCLTAEIGNYGSLFSLQEAVGKIADPILVSGTDGVGTKLVFAQKAGKHNTIGIDLVAMSVNDVLTRGAQPLYFLDYYASGTLDVNVAAEVIAGIAEGCKQAGCGLIGGETAEMPGIYDAGVYDLAGFAVGVVAKQNLLPHPVHADDVLIGLASTGLHSNGFSLVRKVVEKSQLSLAAEPPFTSQHKTLGEALLTPTRIYVASLKEILKQDLAVALAHITGSGMPGNLPRVYGADLVATIDTSAWQVPAVYKWIAKTGPVATDEMLNTFNCGIGMIMIVKPQYVDKVLQIMAATDVPAFKIGKMRKRKHDEPQVEFVGDLFAGI